MSYSKEPPDDGPMDLLKKQYVDGGLTLSEFEEAVDHYLETGGIPADALGVSIPSSVKARASDS